MYCIAEWWENLDSFLGFFLYNPSRRERGAPLLRVRLLSTCSSWTPPTPESRGGRQDNKDESPGSILGPL